MAGTVWAAALLLCTACAGGGEKQEEAKMSGKTTRIPFVTIDPGRVYASREPEPGVLNTDEMVGSPPECYWIRSEQGWKRFGFKQASPPGDPVSPEEKAARELDFARHDVLYLTMGVQGTTGYSMALESIERTGQEVRLTLATKRPKPRQAVGEALTNPSVMVRLEKLPDDAKIRMVRDGKEIPFRLHGLDANRKEGMMDAFDVEMINPQPYYDSVEPDADAAWYPTVPEMKPALLWIRSEKGWRRAGYKHPLPPSPAPDEGERRSREPDFSVYDVLHLTLGLQGTTGDQVIIDRVENKGPSLRIIARHVVDTEAQGEAMTWVRTMVRVSKLPKGKGIALTVNGKDKAFELKVAE